MRIYSLPIIRLFFPPIKNLDLKTPAARVIEAAIKDNVAVYCAHTNWDVILGGVSDTLAEILDIQVKGYLDDGAVQHMAKLVVFTPLEFADLVREHIFNNQGGVIGRYSHCSFALQGEGTYRPMEGAHPFKGTPGSIEKAEEVRLEVIVPRSDIQNILEKIGTVHPYEEIAYDVYPALKSNAPRWYG